MSTEGRIYQDATKSTDNRKLVHGSIYGSGYIDGALSERNKTVEEAQEVARKFSEEFKEIDLRYKVIIELINKLESLKV